MTPIADMIERMFSGGIPPEFIVLAVRTLELARGEDPVAERRRAYDRERKRAISGGIPVEKEIPPTPPKEKTLTQEPNGSFVSRRKRVRGAYSEAFEGFWAPYPRTPVMSKKQAFTEWERLSESDQSTACAAVPAFKTWLAGKPGHEIVHACRFLSQRRFEGFAGQELAAEPLMNGCPHNGEVRAGQIWWHMESEEYRKHNETRTDRYCGWWFKQEAAA